MLKRKSFGDLDPLASNLWRKRARMMATKGGSKLQAYDPFDSLGHKERLPPIKEEKEAVNSGFALENNLDDYIVWNEEGSREDCEANLFLVNGLSTPLKPTYLDALESRSTPQSTEKNRDCTANPTFTPATAFTDYTPRKTNFNRIQNNGSTGPGIDMADIAQDTGETSFGFEDAVWSWKDGHEIGDFEDPNQLRPENHKDTSAERMNQDSTSLVSVPGLHDDTAPLLNSGISFGTADLVREDTTFISFGGNDMIEDDKELKETETTKSVHDLLRELFGDSLSPQELEYNTAKTDAGDETPGLEDHGTLHGDVSASNPGFGELCPEIDSAFNSEYEEDECGEKDLGIPQHFLVNTIQLKRRNQLRDPAQLPHLVHNQLRPYQPFGSFQVSSINPSLDHVHHVSYMQQEIQASAQLAEHESISLLEPPRTPDKDSCSNHIYDDPYLQQQMQIHAQSSQESSPGLVYQVRNSPRHDQRTLDVIMGSLLDGGEISFPLLNRIIELVNITPGNSNCTHTQLQLHTQSTKNNFRTRAATISKLSRVLLEKKINVSQLIDLKDQIIRILNYDGKNQEAARNQSLPEDQAISPISTVSSVQTPHNYQGLSGSVAENISELKIEPASSNCLIQAPYLPITEIICLLEKGQVFTIKVIPQPPRPASPVDYGFFVSLRMPALTSGYHVQLRCCLANCFGSNHKWLRHDPKFGEVEDTKSMFTLVSLRQNDHLRKAACLEMPEIQSVKISVFLYKAPHPDGITYNLVARANCYDKDKLLMEDERQCYAMHSELSLSWTIPFQTSPGSQCSERREKLRWKDLSALIRFAAKSRFNSYGELRSVQEQYRVARSLKKPWHLLGASKYVVSGSYYV